MSVAQSTMEPGLIGLRDIALMEPVSYLPATPAWGVVAVVVVVALGWLAWRRLVAWRADAYRRAALTELASLEARLVEPSGRGDAIAGLSPLVKRTAMSFLPRERVAALSGDEWLRFLDEVGPTPAFVDGPGRMLEALTFCRPERREALGEDETRQLFDAVRVWVRDHERPATTAGEGGAVVRD